MARYFWCFWCFFGLETDWKSRPPQIFLWRHCKQPLTKCGGEVTAHSDIFSAHSCEENHESPNQVASPKIKKHFSSGQGGQGGQGTGRSVLAVALIQRFDGITNEISALQLCSHTWSWHCLPNSGNQRHSVPPQNLNASEDIWTRLSLCDRPTLLRPRCIDLVKPFLPTRTFQQSLKRLKQHLFQLVFWNSILPCFFLSYFVLASMDSTSVWRHKRRTCPTWEAYRQWCCTNRSSANKNLFCLIPSFEPPQWVWSSMQRQGSTELSARAASFFCLSWSGLQLLLFASQSSSHA